MSKKNLTLNIITVLLLLSVTVCGVCSFNPHCAYDGVNQYGEAVKMWGAGIYARDTYFMAPIFIGSDLTILLFVLPSACLDFLRMKKNASIENRVRVFGVLSLILYYAASAAFGITYNALHLLYIALFGVCFFGAGAAFINLHTVGVCCEKVCTYSFSKGMKVFLLLSGVSLFVAWLPDIILSLVNNAPLKTIEGYTTGITNVLDMGVISPLMFVTYYLLKKDSFAGYVLLRMIFRICKIVGIMVPVQTLFQYLGGISVPLPELITKVFIFMVLAVFAASFEFKLRRTTRYAEEILTQSERNAV